MSSKLSVISKGSRWAGWEQWQAMAAAGGARAMRRYTKLRQKWVPSVREQAPGTYSASPEKFLQAEADKLEQCWDPRASPPEL